MADVILNLVHHSNFQKLVSMTLQELFEKVEDSSLRNYRPELDSRFHRDFDVDLEGDIMEWSDKISDLVISETIYSQPIKESEIAELTILLAKWCSFSEWRCWDARLFLYVEPMLEYNISNSNDFLKFSLWEDFMSSLSKTDKKSYSESVVLDWMSRREELGETMEPSEDPRILPTMSSHSTSSELLHIFLDSFDSKNISLLIGREYLEYESWSLNGSYLYDLEEIVK
ncbi:MAG: hypothetical protein CMA51_00555 [Euryarchaeota archaeon]|nr:hypothetical protein [Euryarchaeota archaeon]|tara:strand:- start:6285 stop:6968 length:684 start_codon:yes stop_codon:yes gene_type:complete